ncbi:glycosyltransferase family 1 protein [Sphingomonas sp. ASV193]|uniref:glycosyltransferase family 4 protein n=1 Tax=Sphingomonas sp. ASV193 TaxID=3144405 RepID=UPI0032E8CB33
MEPSDLRIALFSGNYNYVRDGANQALNRLVGYLLRQGAAVRVYSPVVEHPAFPPTGDLVDVPSVAIPGRAEYRVPISLSGEARRDLEAFAPNIVHVSSPDIVAHRAVSWARERGIPVMASVHTRFETYLKYYHLELFEPAVRALLRRFYRRCDAIMAPAESTAAILRAQRMSRDIGIWSRGVDRDQFNPDRRSEAWRAAHGIGAGDVMIAFLGRVVMEKGLDVFAAAIQAAQVRDARVRALVIGDGPALPWFKAHMPADTVFAGHQVGTDLAVALASADVFFNPSITEAFGNVTQEAMACGLPVVAAIATGAQSLVLDGVTGTLVDPEEVEGFAEALLHYTAAPEVRRAHGEAGLDYTKDRDWDSINDAVLRNYIRLVARRERLKSRFGNAPPRLR